MTYNITCDAAAGLMSARLSSLDDQFLEAFPLSGPWLEALQDGVGKIAWSIITEATGPLLVLSCNAEYRS